MEHSVLSEKNKDINVDVDGAFKLKNGKVKMQKDKKKRNEKIKKG